jgi:hypothetical protein
MDKDFCRKAILGAFVQGYFHNLRGSLQGVYLPLQRIMLNPSKYLTEEGLALFQKMMSSLDKLNNQLNIALADLTCEDEGPWDLFEVMQKEMLFWEADLRFKHKIKKEVIEKSKATVKLPYNILLGILCLVEAELYQALNEGSELKIAISSEPNPCVTFSWSGSLNLQNLEKVAELIKPYATVKEDENSLTLCFNQ